MTSIVLMIGTTELLLIAGVALLLFGGKKLPELMRGMGQGVKSFKEGLNSPVEKEEDSAEDEDDKAKDDGSVETTSAKETADAPDGIKQKPRT